MAEQPLAGHINARYALESNGRAHTDRGKAVLFGGANTIAEAETWEWDAAGWVERKPASSPSGRCSHAMAYDSDRKKVILFGGQSVSGRLCDTWEWDSCRRP